MCISALMNDLRWPEPPFWLDEVLPTRIYKTSDLKVKDVFKFSGHSPQQVKELLLRICSELNVSPSYLARRAGLAASTLNRFLRQAADDASNLTATTIDSILRAAAEEMIKIHSPKMASNDLFVQANEEAVLASIERSKTNYDQHVREWRHHSLKISTGACCDYPRSHTDRNAHLIGRIENGFFFEPTEWGDDRFRSEVSVPLLVRDGASLIMMPLNGNAGLPLYPAGSIIIGTMLCTTNLPPPPGAHVIAFHRRSDDWLSCNIWRYMTDPANRAWLMPIDERFATGGALVGANLNADLNTIYVSHVVAGYQNENVW